MKCIDAKPMNYPALINNIIFLCETLETQISIKDVKGFIKYIDRELAFYLVSYMTHTNSYCMYIKSGEKSGSTCYFSIWKILRKINRVNGPFYGTCRAGTGEFIIPIGEKNNYIGFLTVGPFKLNNKVSKYLIKKVCNREELNYNSAKDKYMELPGMKYTIEYIYKATALIAENIYSLYKIGRQEGMHIDHEGVQEIESEFLQGILDYIRLNYQSNINIDILSRIFHSSRSNISHMFKRKTGLNINKYINQTRILEAKKLLIDTELSITSISSLVGFDDSNYFSRVFHNECDVYPSIYRRINKNIG